MTKRIIIVPLVGLLLVAAIIVNVSAHTAAPQVLTKTPTSYSAKSQAPRGNTSFDKNAHSTTDPSSIWVIVNKQHPLQPMNYAPADLVSVGNGQVMRAEAAQALENMLKDAADAGYTVTAASGYRSYDTQVAAYNSEVAAYGKDIADSESARPGYSEHQTGLAVDLGSDGCNISDCFASTPGGKWVTANAYRYGFLLRYQADIVDITGYRAEAWHFRYVGILLATEMHNEGVETLEQFFGVSGGTTYAP